MDRPLKIVMLGIRGVPASYGGFETCVEEVGSRLAAKGHDVTVYCRCSHYKEREQFSKGMRRIFLPCLHVRALETLSHTALSAWHALFHPADVFVAFNAANILALLPLRLRRAPLLINTDGQEWKRRKWGRFSRGFFKISERICTWLASRVITDGKAMAAYYRSEYNTETTTIAYGAKIQESVNPELIRQFGVETRGYFLQITRFEPENNPLLTVQSFLRLNTDKKLILVGGVTYEGEYQKQLQALAGDRVIMPGFIYDQAILRELWTNCLAYVHGNEVGGTNPALLQAMAYGCYVLSRDVVFNREPLGDHARFYSLEPESLVAAMQYALDHQDALDSDRAAVKQIIRDRYSWDLVADQYEALCRAAVDRTTMP